MRVLYQNEWWYIINQPVGRRLMAELRDSDPYMRIRLISCNKSNEIKDVMLSEITFQYEH